MVPKWQCIILGVCLALWGAKILIDPVYFSNQFQCTFDFSEIKWVFGGGLVIIGSCFVVSSITRKKDDK
jgi:hypothetical protein